MKKYCWIIIITFFFSQNSFTQIVGGDMPPTRDPGTCYAKCLIQSNSIFEEYEETYPIYIGDNPDSFKFEIIEIITSEAKTEWIKKRADRNCLSDDPNDCQVWCLVETPPIIIEIEVLGDTAQTKDFIYETFLIEEETVLDDARTEWRRVVCETNVNPELIEDLQEALRNRGYYDNNNSLTSMISSELKAALKNFQRKNGLPTGQLDFETLEALDLNVNRF